MANHIGLSVLSNAAILSAVPTNTERFYKQLSSVRALQALIGKPENADFDCKEWPARQDDARRIIAKAACGFTNATGGVIVIGVKASGAGANTPDVVRSLASVADRHAVASAALDIILQSVEPGKRHHRQNETGFCRQGQGENDEKSRAKGTRKSREEAQGGLTYLVFLWSLCAAGSAFFPRRPSTRPFRRLLPPDRSAELIPPDGLEREEGPWGTDKSVIRQVVRMDSAKTSTRSRSDIWLLGALGHLAGHTENMRRI